MGGKRDLKTSKKDLRKVRNGGKCKIAQGELKSARRSMKRKVKAALRKGEETPAAGSVPHMY